MAYNKISSTMMENLDHEINEIRIRSLKQVEGKVLRALQQNEILVFNAGKLVKKLIGWFGQQPLVEIETVLNLILVILRSQYGNEAIRIIGLERFKKEVGKIFEIVQSSPCHKELVVCIIDLLDDFLNVSSRLADDIIDISSPSIPGSEENSIDICSVDDILNDEFSADYEEPWSVPSVSDLNSLNELHNSLSTMSESEEIRNGLEYFKYAINDYPVEYFLQPPYIFKNLIKLYMAEKTLALPLLNNLTYMTKSVICRIKKRKISNCYIPNTERSLVPKSKTQITIQRFCIEVFKICIDHLKEFSESLNQNEIFWTYSLIFEIIKLMEHEKSASKISIKSFLIDLGILAKFYRTSIQMMEKPYRIYRTQYILIIYIMAKLVNQQQIQKSTNLYNPNDYASFNENYGAAEETTNDSTIWHSELKKGILDFPLKALYPTYYNEIKQAIDVQNIQTKELRILLNCKNDLQPAIDILRNPEGIKDEGFILLGIKALDTLSIHKSLDLVRKLIDSISQCIPLFDGNKELKTISEEILLKLFAHENLTIKRLTYKESANNVKHFFATLMNGKNILSRLHNPQFERAKILGIPLTMEIISEIICFGYLNADSVISTNAETILSLILKGKSILPEYWETFLEILIPNFPLLQCLTKSTTDLGKSIINFFNPDNNLPIQELIQGNLRLLFANDSLVRTEALSRIIYILSSDSSQSEFLPNILEISDTLPNDICCLQVPRDPEKIFYGGLYDPSTVRALLELLKSEDVEPNIRKTTLMQLNITCQNIELNEMIVNENGWYFVVEALENSLKKNPSSDYADSAIPAIGMISKFILCNPAFRRDLAKESNIYILLIRALFFFHHDITLQQDCSITLFLLLFSNHIIGGGTKISMAKIFENIKLPLKCEFHWQKSPYNKKSQLEEVYLDLSRDNENNNNNTGLATMENHRSATSIPYSRRSEPIYSFVKENQYCDNTKHQLQFLRLNFANIWFKNFEAILKSFNTTKTDLSNSTLDYSIIPGNFNEIDGGVIEVPEIFKFNRNLELTRQDIRFVQISSCTENIKKNLKKITNASSHNEFIKNLAAIRISLMIYSNQKIESDIFLRTFQRSLNVQPKNDSEVIIFINVLQLFRDLIIHKYDKIISWILREFSEQNCAILQILKEYNLPIILTETICDFIQTLIYFCLENSENNKIQELVTSENNENSSNRNFYNLYNKLFEYLIQITEECFHKRYLDRVRYFLNLLQKITESKKVEVDLGFFHTIAKKLLYFIMTLKLFHQGGSHLNKNCLLIIGNLMHDVDEVILDENHVKLLSGLCSHEDFEIRTLSWCILIKVAKCLRGAHMIVKELSYLPGGFHACCLSTLLDKNEVPVVRSSAGAVFANLLNHKSSEADGLHMSVAPLCIDAEADTANNGIQLIKQVFFKHQFYAAITISIESFHINDIEQNYMLKDITTCSIIESYCLILSNFIDLNCEIAEELCDQPFLLKIFNIIKIVPSCITPNSLTMVSKICYLINHLTCLENTKSIKKNLSTDHGLIVTLIQLLDLKYYENLNKKVLVNILQTLKILSNETFSYQLICDILTCNGASKMIELLAYGISENNNTDIQNITLKFLTSLLVKSNSESTDKHQSITQIFDSINLSKNIKENKPTSEIKNNLSTSCKRRYDKISSAELVTGNVVLFQSLLKLFHVVFLKRIKSKEVLLSRKTLISEAIAILLRTSDKARESARSEEFLLKVIDRINSIFENIPTSCTDFIRKHGDLKKEPIIQELMILYGIILHWFSVDCLTDEVQIVNLSKIVLSTWPWINHSESLREIFIKCLVFLSEDSLIVCRQFSLPITSFANSIIHLISKMVQAETNKVKQSNIDFNILELGLRFLSNCCSCIEGRLQIVKMNLLDIISNFHPSNTKLHKSWNTIIVLWLKFWEIFSRYPEGASVKHLYLICTLIAKSNPSIRILCLKILRNMAFLVSNRPNLLSSQDFLYTMNEVLLTGNDKEKFTAVITIWKLIADNYKAKHTIKNSGIPRKLKDIQEKIDQTDEENDLYSVIEIVLKYLK